MEPTIYKPSVYKGAGIYKTGAEGGGGGGGNLPEGYTKHYALKITSLGMFSVTDNLKISGEDIIYFHANLDTNSNPNYKILNGNNLYLDMYYGGLSQLVVALSLAHNNTLYSNPSKSNGDISILASGTTLIYNAVKYYQYASKIDGEFKPLQFLWNNGPVIIYSFTVTSKDGNRKNDFIPCTDNGGNLGLFDIVNSEFSAFTDQSNISSIDL